MNKNVGIPSSMDCLIAVGYTSKGEEKKFPIKKGQLDCRREDLVSLDVPHGVVMLFCGNNSLNRLNLPESVIYVECTNNLISEINIPIKCIVVYCNNNLIRFLDLEKCDKVKTVECKNNLIEVLDICDTVDYLIADKEVSGLGNIIDNCKISLF